MNRMETNDPQLAAMGRDGDTHLAHVADGELIVPPVISDELRERLHAEMAAAGIDPEGHTVGQGMSINPLTGQPEFGFFKKVFKVFKAVAPVALPLALGPLGLGLSPLAAGAIGGGASGLLSGGGLRGALAGAAGGALSGGIGGGGLGASLAGKAGLSGLAQQAVGGALGGGVKGLINNGFSGGLRGALSGAAQGAGSNLVGNAFGSLGDARLSQGAQGLAGFGQGGAKLSSGAASLGGPSQSLFSKGLGTLNTYASPLATALGAIGGAEDDLSEAQRRAQGEYAPYRQTGLQANRMLQEQLASGGLGGEFQFEEDPGYQFALQQGEEALGRRQSASGNRFSGGALKAAQEYGQGLANQQYNRAFGRDLQRQQNLYNILSGQQGVGVRMGDRMAESYGQLGNIGAGAGVARGNILTGGGLSDLLSGRRGYDMPRYEGRWEFDPRTHGGWY